MTKRETINGTPVTEEQIAAWAAEAEAGFDVEALKKRGRGRPGRGAEPSQVVALRLTVDEIAAIDARAAREGKSRSEIIRLSLQCGASPRCAYGPPGVQSRGPSGRGPGSTNPERSTGPTVPTRFEKGLGVDVAALGAIPCRAAERTARSRRRRARSAPRIRRWGESRTIAFTTTNRASVSSAPSTAPAYTYPASAVRRTPQKSMGSTIAVCGVHRTRGSSGSVSGAGARYPEIAVSSHDLRDGRDGSILING